MLSNVHFRVEDSGFRAHTPSRKLLCARGTWTLWDDTLNPTP